MSDLDKKKYPRCVESDQNIHFERHGHVLPEPQNLLFVYCLAVHKLEQQELYLPFIFFKV